MRMRYYYDGSGNVVTDRGLGLVQIGPGGGSAPGGMLTPGEARAGFAFAQNFVAPPAYPYPYTVAPVAPNPCPPPGYPTHTQWNGQTCCTPQPCVPQQPVQGTAEALTGCGTRCAFNSGDGLCYCQTPAGNWKNSPGCCGARPGSASNLSVNAGQSNYGGGGASYALSACGGNCGFRSDGLCWCQTAAGNWKNSPGCCGARPTAANAFNTGVYSGGGYAASSSAMAGVAGFGMPR